MKKFKCKLCNEEFNTLSEIGRHTLQKHTPKKERTFSCPECSNVFTTLNRLNRHIQLKHQIINNKGEIKNNRNDIGIVDKKKMKNGNNIKTADKKIGSDRNNIEMEGKINKSEEKVKKEVTTMTTNDYKSFLDGLTEYLKAEVNKSKQQSGEEELTKNITQYTAKVDQLIDFLTKKEQEEQQRLRKLQEEADAKVRQQEQERINNLFDNLSNTVTGLSNTVDNLKNKIPDNLSNICSTFPELCQKVFRLEDRLKYLERETEQRDLLRQKQDGREHPFKIASHGGKNVEEVFKGISECPQCRDAYTSFVQRNFSSSTAQEIINFMDSLKTPKEKSAGEQEKLVDNKEKEEKKSILF